MEEIAAGVEFDTIAREWRCKWSPDGDKASLVACQMALESVVEDINEVEGIKSIERVVCGGCLDFKVSCSLDFILFYFCTNIGMEHVHVFTVLYFELFGMEWNLSKFSCSGHYICIGRRFLEMGKGKI